MIWLEIKQSLLDAIGGVRPCRRKQYEKAGLGVEMIMVS